MKDKHAIYILGGALGMFVLGCVVGNYTCKKEHQEATKKIGADGSDEKSNYAGMPQAGMPAGGAPLAGVLPQAPPIPVGTPPTGTVDSGGSFRTIGAVSDGGGVPPSPTPTPSGLGWGGFGYGYGYPVFVTPQCYTQDASGVSILTQCGSDIDLGIDATLVDISNR